MIKKLVKEIEKAHERIKNYVRETPLEHFYAENHNWQVFLKLENYQVTNSFKIRGIANKLLSLSDRTKQKGVVTASTGNHGHAFAYMVSLLSIPGVVFVPENIASGKLKILERYKSKVKILFHGQDCLDTEVEAKKFAKENKMLYVSPYNDKEVIAGQGTVGLELSKQLEQIDNVLVPIGGGGLISGIGAYVKHINPDVKIIGCQPENSAVMYESIKAGKIINVESKPTLSDATAGGIEKGSITFDLCQKLVDDYVLLSEDEIAEAMYLMLSEYFMCVEGAGALSIAAYKKIADKLEGNTVIIVSGAKIDFDSLLDIRSKQL